uniref:PAP-associated domain-containing protein n=1 Tax=Caenorhabditis tropicalis TaxID=1561998 RepID=A0A1I7TAG7_9PELO
MSAAKTVSMTIPAAPELKMLPTNAAPAPSKIGQKMVKSCGIEMPKWKEAKLSAEIEANNSSGEEHRQKMRLAAAYFRAVIQATFPDAKVSMTGSFAAGIDLPSSDLDFTLTVPSLEKKTDRFAKLMAIRGGFSRYGDFDKLQVTRGTIPVLKMVHVKTAVEVDVTIDNEAPKANTKLLATYGQIDERFSKLCRGVKKWASETGVENSKWGRLNSFSICLLLVHFLQHVGVLPKELPEVDGDLETLKDRDIKKEIGWVPRNKDSLGSLFWGFMLYYSRFDFKTQWISVRQGRSLEKRWDRWEDEEKPMDGMPKNNRMIVVEDPFLVPGFNCARSLRQYDIFHRILDEFAEAEKAIRESHRIPFQKTNERLRIEEEGKERDCQIKEIETELLRLSWQDQKLMRERVSREDPKTFWDLKSKESKCWPDIVGFA